MRVLTLLPMTTTTQTRFTADIKASMLAQLDQHAKADEIIQGTYWENGKGCAVGCLTHCPDGGHKLFPELFGLPEWFAHLIDKIFEGLPAEQAKAWPQRVIAAIPADAVLDDAFKDQLAIARLHAVLEGREAWPDSVRQQVVDAIEGVIRALEGDGDRGSAELAAESAARSGAGVAESGAWSAAWSAWSAAGSGVWSAVWSAAWSARSAEWSAARSAEADRLISALEAL